MSKELMVFIKDAKYYASQQSIVIVGLEAESKKPITQQITVKTFLEGTGRFSALEIDTVVKDPDRCRLLANSLKSRREPFKLIFEGTQTEAELKAWFEAENAKGENG